jgi:RNA polymerase sigma-70 factor (ECF subfamily)
MDEEALIRAAQQGDVTAFNRLVLQYQDMAYGVACRITSDPHLAADAAQEAFISAHRGLPGFRGGSFRAWLMRIVTNACYDELRRRKRHPQISLDALYVEDTPPEGYSSSPLESPEDHVQRQELGQMIQAGIDLLPDDQRLVLVLSDVQGFSYEEIAEAAGVPRGTVKSRLHRARAKLRDYLREREELLPARYRLSSDIPMQG